MSNMSEPSHALLAGLMTANLDSLFGIVRRILNEIISAHGCMCVCVDVHACFCTCLWAGVCMHCACVPACVENSSW